MTRTIEMIISPTGEATLQTKGFAGSECREASKFLERTLGQVVADTPTAEMYQAAETRPLRQSSR
jgi:hypothetical protein